MLAIKAGGGMEEDMAEVSAVRFEEETNLETAEYPSISSSKKRVSFRVINLSVIKCKKRKEYTRYLSK